MASRNIVRLHRLLHTRAQSPRLICYVTSGSLLPQARVHKNQERMIHAYLYATFGTTCLGLNGIICCLPTLRRDIQKATSTLVYHVQSLCMFASASTILRKSIGTEGSIVRSPPTISPNSVLLIVECRNLAATITCAHSSKLR
jgi:hypothetical protein